MSTDKECSENKWTSSEEEYSEENCRVQTAEEIAREGRLRAAVLQFDIEGTKRAIDDGASLETTCEEGSVLYNWCM